MNHGSLCLYLIYISTGLAAMEESAAKEERILTNEEEDRQAGFGETLGSCLAGKEHAALECVNRGALTALRSIDRNHVLDFGDAHLERADGLHGRELLDWDYDPKDFGNVVRAATKLMERRSLRWNLDNVYPGLELRAGPMLNGNGILEFVVNEKSTIFGDRQALGPGRQMMRHLLIPFLLGFKFNLASLIPLLFGFLLLLTKKALLLTKVALVITGLLGWNSLLSAHPSGGGGGGGGVHSYEAHGAFPPHYEHYYNFHHRPPPYRGFQGNDFEPYGQHVIREVVDVYDNADQVGKNKGRKNFVWAKSNN